MRAGARPLSRVRKIAGIGAVLMAAVGAPVVVGVSPALADCATAGCPAPVPLPPGAFKFPQGARWQYQLQAARNAKGTACLYPSTGGINTGITGTSFATGMTVAPTVFDIDFQTDALCTGGTITQENAAAVSALHAQGAHVIGYIDAGGGESFRPDFPQYQSFNNSCSGCLFGRPISGFRNEFWLNINNNVFGHDPNDPPGTTESAQEFILEEVGARLARVKADGFDGVEFDVVDSWANNTGLSISPDTQLQFNAQLANMAHQQGLSVALKNDVEQIPDLLPYFDFAINEQCQQYRECATLQPFLSVGDAVYQVEYKLSTGKFCPQANQVNRSAIVKTFDLFDTPWTPCN
jgi:hypothetical protein